MAQYNEAKKAGQGDAYLEQLVGGGGREQKQTQQKRERRRLPKPKIPEINWNKAGKVATGMLVIGFITLGFLPHLDDFKPSPAEQARQTAAAQDAQKTIKDFAAWWQGMETPISPSGRLCITVDKGEGLFSVRRRLGLDIHDLSVNPGPLHPGQTVCKPN